MIRLRITPKVSSETAATITEFNKENIKILHSKLHHMLDEFCKENGLIVGPSHMRYGLYSASMGRVDFTIKGRDKELREGTNKYKPANCIYKVGDLVSAIGRRRDALKAVYCIWEFSRTGRCRIKRVPDGRMFSCQPRILREPYGGKR